MSETDPHANEEPQPTPAVDEADRGIPQVGRKRRANSALIALVTAAVVLFVLVIGAHFLIQNLHGNGDQNAKKGLAAIIPKFPADAFAVASSAPPPPPLPSRVGPSAPPVALSPAGGPMQAPPGKQMTPAEQEVANELARRQRAPLLAIFNAGTAPVSRLEREHFDANAANNYGSLGKALQATAPAAVSASRIEDLNLIITQGTMIHCVLETAISSEEPGMTRCVLPQDVYSANGRVLLLERGSHLVGQYESGQLQQGMSRIFVIWTRAITPAGVSINLDSPATDSLGRSGLSGRINTHFAARYGAALLVSVVQDLANYEVAKQQQGGSTQLNFGSTVNSSKDLATIIAQHNLNIRPTLDKNQGGEVGVFVARDLYFGNVYALKPVSHTSR